MLLAVTWASPAAVVWLVLGFALLGPPVLLLLAARSLLSSEPLPRWALVAVAVGGGGLGFLLWLVNGPNGQGAWKVWWAAAWPAAALAPVVVVREGLRRGWFGRWG